MASTPEIDPVAVDPLHVLPLTNLIQDEQGHAASSPAPSVKTAAPEPMPEKPQANPPAPIDIKPRPDSSPGPTAPLRRAGPPETFQYIVKSGDTMMSIADAWFGDAAKWSLIAKANPWVDPSRMQIGQTLQLPPKDAKPEPITQQQTVSDKSSYVVRSGDTLAKIARGVYGDYTKWRLIYQTNRVLIGDDPAALKPGMKLTLPPASKTPTPAKPKSR
jgi:nucleoid-associated protein YgaU